MNKIDLAITTLQKGGMAIIVDDATRENEGDLVISAEYATPEAINFIAQYARGVICLSLDETYLKKFQLDLQPQRSNSKTTAQFTVSIDATKGITTGISVADRAKTIKTVLNPNAKPEDLCTPGHIFPLRAEPLGVLKRRGHTEASLDLMKIAGLKPAAVICEILNLDGSMANANNLLHFATQHGLPCISVEDIAKYRLTHETLVYQYAQTILPTAVWGNIVCRVFRNLVDNSEIIALHPPTFDPKRDTPIRLHSACMTGDLMGSLRCDCGDQFKLSMSYITEYHGVLLYLPQEGRGIGLGDKIRAYALQDQGLNTVEANIQLGFKADKRNYAWAVQVLKQLKLQRIQLLTNNPDKINQLAYYGFTQVNRIPLLSKQNSHNMKYLYTKKKLFHHLIELQE